MPAPFQSKIKLSFDSKCITVSLETVAAPDFLSGEAKGGKTFLGGKSIWLPITHFHNRLRGTYSIIPNSSPFPLIYLFSLLPVVPFLSTSLSFPSPALPSLDTARGLGERCKLPHTAGPGGARPPNEIR